MKFHNATMVTVVELLTGAHGRDAEHASFYRELRRGQKWSVIDVTGYTLRGEALDTAIRAAMKGGA